MTNIDTIKSIQESSLSKAKDLALNVVSSKQEAKSDSKLSSLYKQNLVTEQEEHSANNLKDVIEKKNIAEINNDTKDINALNRTLRKKKILQVDQIDMNIGSLMKDLNQKGLGAENKQDLNELLQWLSVPHLEGSFEFEHFEQMIKDMKNLPNKNTGSKILEEKTTALSSSSKDFMSALPVSPDLPNDAKMGLNTPQLGITKPNKDNYKKAMLSAQLSFSPIGSSDKPSNSANESSELSVKNPAKEITPDKPVEKNPDKVGDNNTTSENANKDEACSSKEEKRSKAEQQKQEQINKYDEKEKKTQEKLIVLKTQYKDISIKMEFLRTGLQELEDRLSWEIEENADNPCYDPSPLQMEIERKHLSIQRLIMEQEKLIREMESLENKPFDINSLRLEVIDYSINKTKSKISAFDENAYIISQSIENNLAYEDSGFKSIRLADTSYDYSIEENEMPEAVKIFREYGSLVKRKAQNLE